MLRIPTAMITPRISRDLHRRLKAAAAAAGQSLNQYVAQVLETAAAEVDEDLPGAETPAELAPATDYGRPYL